MDEEDLLSEFLKMFYDEKVYVMGKYCRQGESWLYNIYILNDRDKFKYIGEVYLANEQEIHFTCNNEKRPLSPDWTCETSVNLDSFTAEEARIKLRTVLDKKLSYS
jgi:hypothetical protein